MPNRRPLFVAGLLLYVDDGTYVRLERGSLLTDGPRVGRPNWELRRDREWVRQGGTDDGTFDARAPVWLRLERRGDYLLGSHSPDGVSRTALEPLEVSLPRKVQVGVTAGNNTTTPFTATFEGMQLFQCVAGTAPPEPLRLPAYKLIELFLGGELKGVELPKD